MATSSSSGRQVRRRDPGRRDRIIDVCLDVIAEHGVAGTSHRRVAAAADVPLGSLTYHFTGMDQLLREAFDRFTRDAAKRFEDRLSRATDTDTAIEAVVRLITQDVFDTQRDLVLSNELYTLAAREPAYRTLTNTWMKRSRAALGLRFDAQTARILDAFIEGMTIHRSLDVDPPTDDGIEEAVRRLVGAH